MPGKTIQKAGNIHHLYHQHEACIFFFSLLVNLELLEQLIKISLQNQCKKLKVKYTCGGTVKARENRL